METGFRDEVAGAVKIGGERPSAIARSVLCQQAEAVGAMAQAVGPELDVAVALLLECRGNVIVCGMGKSGLVGRKMAATFSSTGTPSYFLHPAEALHGDLGVVRPQDILILISNSGETEEILRLLPSLQEFGNRIIGIGSARSSTLARHSTVFLHLPMEREVCPNNLAPTTSTLLTMALGDALAVSLITLRGFQPLDFARFHPGGSLGRKLLARVRDAMHRHVPAVAPATPLREAIDAMTTGRLGLTVVLEDGRLCGLFTDGDLRRAIERDRQALDRPVADFMSPHPVTIRADARLAEAEQAMHARGIRALVVLDAQRQVAGILDLFDRHGVPQQ
ncbi:putative arabinose 5-phosphate isomerase [Cupriavidus sp. TA19]|uniref:KpsF/GutQ family sugar-phosphate isomerase n=2 Tax=unclassified Cupriavidus TaxID=2640874 RepID=UPI002729400D|nr:KpsF/GutQ family sugar-phosphate isomerase [Cupriavidus sp. TA19]GLC95894.1 putative arabinose 5-phosphate isomerase [Cupriavidus sp. TA19]